VCIEIISGKKTNRPLLKKKESLILSLFDILEKIGKAENNNSASNIVLKSHLPRLG
jgi:hypothetical protein